MNRIGKILAIDGSYLLHRQLHIPEVFELKNNKGVRTGGVFGFLRSLTNEIKKCGDYFPVVCFDNGLAPRRVEADPYYKHADERADRSKQVLTEEESEIDYITQYRKQMSMLEDILLYFGIPVLKYKSWEGDDLLYLLSKMSDRCLVLTDDRDLLQLLSDTCDVRRPMADEYWTKDKFLEENNFESMYDFVIQKAVLGDGSDNIPGSCKGVGKGTLPEFMKLLKYIKSNDIPYPNDEESIREVCKKANAKYRKAFLNFNEDRFITNLQLVDLNAVDIEEPEDFLNLLKQSIECNIMNCENNRDFFKAVSSLGNLDIKEFSVDKLMEAVSVRYNNLFNYKEV